MIRGWPLPLQMPKSDTQEAEPQNPPFNLLKPEYIQIPEMPTFLMLIFLMCLNSAFLATGFPKELQHQAYMELLRESAVHTGAFGCPYFWLTSWWATCAVLMFTSCSDSLLVAYCFAQGMVSTELRLPAKISSGWKLGYLWNVSVSFSSIIWWLHCKVKSPCLVSLDQWDNRSGCSLSPGLLCGGEGQGVEKQARHVGKGDCRQKMFLIISTLTFWRWENFIAVLAWVSKAPELLNELIKWKESIAKSEVPVPICDVHSMSSTRHWGPEK